MGRVSYHNFSAKWGYRLSKVGILGMAPKRTRVEMMGDGCRGVVFSCVVM